ncbi:MAG: DUF1573 domain-containing protein [Rhodospirillales bacterium]|nr:DUF1573 domain-containing protein [Rhodospirillales bacterium]
MRYIIWITFLFMVAATAACGGGAAAGGSPRLALEEMTLALGDVPNGKIVEREVTVRNEGDAPLVVERITTSCGCTTAALEPMTIAPGASGVLTIAFDSGAHGPGLRGPIMRDVRLISNDPALPEAVVAVTANIGPPE